VGLTFESVDEMRAFEHPLTFCDAVYYTEAVVSFKSVDEILEQKLLWSALLGAVYCAVKLVLTVEFVDGIGFKCDHSNESYWAVLSCGAVYYAVKVVLTFEFVDGTGLNVTIQMKALSSTFLWWMKSQMKAIE